ncbi:Uncharacterised protein [uncultured archaeon]|nr:Uncharacterised protein [uncultured archaeon]
MKKKIIILGILLVLIFSVLIGLFITIQETSKNEIREEDNEDIEISFRNLVETAYPDFKDFENQESFAGKKVKFENLDGDRYYVYMVLGSGLPIAEATCFRVDRAGRVFKIGVFPDFLDSYLGYRDIDPKNCKGIK